MLRSKDRLLRLPRDDTDTIDLDALDTEEVTYEDLSEWDIIVDHDLQWVGLVVGDPMWDIRSNGDTVVHVPALNYEAVSLLVDNIGPQGPNKLDTALELFHDIAINFGMERGAPEDAIHIVSSDSRTPL